MSLWPPVRVGQVVHSLLAQTCPTVGPEGPQAHLVFLFPFPGDTIGTDTLGSPTSTPDLSMRASLVGKAK